MKYTKVSGVSTPSKGPATHLLETSISLVVVSGRRKMLATAWFMRQYAPSAGPSGSGYLHQSGTAFWCGEQRKIVISFTALQTELWGA
jgi:hypothetical protein